MQALDGRKCRAVFRFQALVVRNPAMRAVSPAVSTISWIPDQAGNDILESLFIPNIQTTMLDPGSSPG